MKFTSLEVRIPNIQYVRFKRAVESIMAIPLVCIDIKQHDAHIHDILGSTYPTTRASLSNAEWSAPALGKGSQIVYTGGRVCFAGPLTTILITTGMADYTMSLISNGFRTDHSGYRRDPVTTLWVLLFLYTITNKVWDVVVGDDDKQLYFTIPGEDTIISAADLADSHPTATFDVDRAKWNVKLKVEDE